MDRSSNLYREETDEMERIHKGKSKSGRLICFVKLPCYCMIISFIFALVWLPEAMLYPSLKQTTCNIEYVDISTDWVCVWESNSPSATNNGDIDPNSHVYQYTFGPSDGSKFGQYNECYSTKEVDTECYTDPRFKKGDIVKCYIWPNECRGSVLIQYEKDFIICIISAVLFLIMSAIFIWRVKTSYKHIYEYGCYYNLCAAYGVEQEIKVRRSREIPVLTTDINQTNTIELLKDGQDDNDDSNIIRNSSACSVCIVFFWIRFLLILDFQNHIIMDSVLFSNK